MSSSLSDAESESPDESPDGRSWRCRWFALRRPTPLGRCVIFFWLALSFEVTGFALMLTGALSSAVYWDALVYLGGCFTFVGLLWWVCWYSGNIELGVDDAAATAALAAVAVAATTAAGSPDPAFSVGSDFKALMESISRGLVSHHTGSFTATVRSSFSTLTLEISSTSWFSGEASWWTSVHQMTRRTGSWMTKHLRAHPSRVAVQPQDADPQASQEVLSPGHTPVGPRLESSHALPSQPPVTAEPARRPTLPTAGCPPCILPARGHSMPCLPELLTAPRPRPPLRGHSPTLYSTALAWPACSRLAGPASPLPHLETTVSEPPPSVCRDAGDAPGIRRSSSEGAIPLEDVFHPCTPDRQSQGPGSLGTKAQDPRVSHPCSVEICDESP